MDIGLWDKQSFANDQKLEIDQQFFKKMSMHKRLQALYWKQCFIPDYQAVYDGLLD